MKCSILGCGWLGFPLAKLLLKKGFVVKGSTTRKEKLAYLQSEGIDSFFIKVHPSHIEGELDDFLDTDVLVLNFPPGRTRKEVLEKFHASMKFLLQRLEQSSVQQIIFVSSTSVYGNPAKEVTESSPTQPCIPTAEVLLEVETMLRDSRISATILRMAGLVGYNRKPGRFLAGRTDLSNGSAPVNLVHQDDCIQIIYKIISEQHWGDTFNVCADMHPARVDFYTRAAQQLGLRVPEFLSRHEQGGKIVSNQKLKQMLGFEFQYADPYQML